jgi:hypothetical protein
VRRASGITRERLERSEKEIGEHDVESREKGSVGEGDTGQPLIDSLGDGEVETREARNAVRTRQWRDEPLHLRNDFRD